MIIDFKRLISVACAISLLSWSASASTLQIVVDNLRNDKGQLCLCVFSSENSDAQAFPDCDKGRPVRSGKAAISDGKAVITYRGLKDGVYAIAAIHDENGNSRLDVNFLGIPTEGFGVSNNPRLFGSPSFADGKFNLTGNKTIRIDAKYLL